MRDGAHQLVLLFHEDYRKLNSDRFDVKWRLENLTIESCQVAPLNIEPAQKSHLQRSLVRRFLAYDARQVVPRVYELLILLHHLDFAFQVARHMRYQFAEEVASELVT